MDDWDGPDLGGLRADVDHDASRNLFDRRRRRRHQRRRAALGGGLAVLLAGVVAVTAVVVPDERVSVITDEAPEPDPGGEIGFELLADEAPTTRSGACSARRLTTHPWRPSGTSSPSRAPRPRSTSGSAWSSA